MPPPAGGSVLRRSSRVEPPPQRRESRMMDASPLGPAASRSRRNTTTGSAERSVRADGSGRRRSQGKRSTTGSRRVSRRPQRVMGPSDRFYVLCRALAKFMGAAGRLRARKVAQSVENRSAFVVQCFFRRVHRRLRIRRFEAAFRIAAALKERLQRLVARRHASATKIEALVRGYLERRRTEKRLRLRWIGSFERVFARKLAMLRYRKARLLRQEHLTEANVVLSQFMSEYYRIRRQEKLCWSSILQDAGVHAIAVAQYRRDADAAQAQRTAQLDAAYEEHLRVLDEAKTALSAQRVTAAALSQITSPQKDPVLSPVMPVVGGGFVAPQHYAGEDGSVGSLSHSDEAVPWDPEDGGPPLPAEETMALDATRPSSHASPFLASNMGLGGDGSSPSISVGHHKPPPSEELDTPDSRVGHLPPRLCLGHPTMPTAAPRADDHARIDDEDESSPLVTAATMGAPLISVLSEGGGDASPVVGGGRFNPLASAHTAPTLTPGHHEAIRQYLAEAIAPPPVVGAGLSAASPRLMMRTTSAANRRSFLQMLTSFSPAGAPHTPSGASEGHLAPNTRLHQQFAASTESCMNVQSTESEALLDGSAEASAAVPPPHDPMTYPLQNELGCAYGRIIEASEALGRRALDREANVAFFNLVNSLEWSLYVLNAAPTIHPTFVPLLFGLFPRSVAKRAVLLFGEEQSARARIEALHHNVPVRPPWDMTRLRVMPEAPSITKPRALRVPTHTDEAPNSSEVSQPAELTGLVSSMRRPVHSPPPAGTSTARATASTLSTGASSRFARPPANSARPPAARSSNSGSLPPIANSGGGAEDAAAFFGEVEVDVDDDIGVRKRHRRFSRVAGAAAVDMTHQDTDPYAAQQNNARRRSSFLGRGDTVAWSLGRRSEDGSDKKSQPPAVDPAKIARRRSVFRNAQAVRPPPTTTLTSSNNGNGGGPRYNPRFQNIQDVAIQRKRSVYNAMALSARPALRPAEDGPLEPKMPQVRRPVSRGDNRPSSRGPSRSGNASPTGRSRRVVFHEA